MKSDPIFVAGSTGYVGGRLVPQLLVSGYRVRVLARSLEKLQSRPWSSEPGIEMAQGDVLDFESLLKASQGCREAFYLVHSMNPRHRDFSEADRDGARNMVRVAEKAGLKKIIYLGGLGEEGTSLSKHLQSRREVARILQSGPVPVTTLRAAMILGSGSASFEILRYLVEHLPVMITPRWVRNQVQPIAIRNVLYYLQGCLEKDGTAGQTYDIGGPDILTYQKLMNIYAEEAGLSKRWIVPVPVLTPRLSSYWIHLVTPVPSSIGRPLAEGLRNPVLCHDDRIKSVIPQNLLGCRETIKFALGRVSRSCVDTCWTDAGAPSIPEGLQPGDAPYAGGTIIEVGYIAVLEATPLEVWETISRIGGQTGWYSARWLWQLRGMMDRLVGGIGLRKGRRHPSELQSGDVVDFFRVLSVTPPERLQLLAEMRFPGEATLEFRIHLLGENQSEIRLLSRYLPKGLAGFIYWYALYPFHHIVFRAMLHGIIKAVRRPIIQRPRTIKYKR